MREWLFVFLYGALFFTGLFLAPFWAGLAARRYKRIGGRWTVRSDRYFMLASAIAVLSVGDEFVFGARSLGHLHYGLTTVLRDNWDALSIGIGLSIGLLGKLMLVWLADLEREPPVWSWTRFAVIATALWGLVSVAVILLT